MSKNEFWFFFGILLTAILEGKVGNMWDADLVACNQGHIRTTNYSELIAHRRFKNVSIFMSFVFADSSQEHTDVWWQVLAVINGFNTNRKR